MGKLYNGVSFVLLVIWFLEEMFIIIFDDNVFDKVVEYL